MLSIIAARREQVEEACAKYPITQLWLFGSAAGNAEKFDDESDLDFLLEIDRDHFPFCGFKDPFFQLAADLEDMFGRRVQMVEFYDRTDPYFRQNVTATRELLYDTRRAKVSR